MPMTVEERVRLERVEAAMGVGWWLPRKDWATLQNDPRSELPSGDYPLYFRIREIGNAIDGAVAKVSEFEDRLAQFDGQTHSDEPTPTHVDASAVLQKIASDFNIHFGRDVVAIGMEPDPNVSAQLQIGGDRASIMGRSNVKGTDEQNRGEVHSNEIELCETDGGFRILQYGTWGIRGFIRNTLNRAFTVLALDSEGDICQSKVAVGADKDGGQLWYIISDFSRKVVQFCTFQTGWQIEICETVSAYSDRARKRL